YRVLYIIAALTIVIAGMRASTNILVPMLLAVFISIICSYPLNKMRLLGISKNLSILITVVSIFIIAFLLTLILGTSIGDFSDSMPLYQSKLEELLANIGAKLQRFGIDFDYTEWRQYFDPGVAFGFAESLLKGLRSALTNAFLIGLTVIFILLEIPLIDEEKMEKSLASPSNAQIIIQKIRHYFGIKTMTSLVTGIAITIWLLIIGVDYPVLWGLVAFLLNFVPNIGSIIAAVPAVLLALLMNGTMIAILTVVGYVVVNITIGNVVEPRVMGKGLGLRMLVVFVSLVFWGWVLGPIGMLLAVPLTMTLKIMLKNYEQTRPFALLLENPEEEEAIESS
ncbi:MAG: AI-2E family transporter, partial [Gammaproteobacteria bacterium]|nr:AI-2E family transporter [Gammaproteobacteria bacterium]